MDETPSEAGRQNSLEQKTMKKEKPRVLSGQVLPSDRHPFQTHFEVVKRFVALSHNGNQPIDASRVEGEGIPTQAGSLNVRFLRAIGLLTATDRGLYLPTPDAMRFVSARSVSDEKARPILKKLLEGTWFVETARNYLSPVNPVSEDVFVGELAIAAQTDKEKREQALRVIVDYLDYAGVARRTEKGLLLANDVSAEKGIDIVRTLVAAAPLPVQAQALAVDLPPLVPENAGWQVLQTEDFYLRIKSDLTVIRYLSDHLDLIRRKLVRSQREIARMDNVEAARTDATDKRDGQPSFGQDSAQE